MLGSISFKFEFEFERHECPPSGRPKTSLIFNPFDTPPGRLGVSLKSNKLAAFGHDWRKVRSDKQ